MTVKPIHHRILVKRLEAQETLRSGLVIPDTAKEQSLEGQAIAAGSGGYWRTGASLPCRSGPGIGS